MLGIPLIQNDGDLHRNWTEHLISVPIAYFNPVQETLVMQELNCHQKWNHRHELMQLIWTYNCKAITAQTKAHAPVYTL